MKSVDVYYIKTPHVSNVTSSYPRCSFLKGTMHGIGVRNDQAVLIIRKQLICRACVAQLVRAKDC